MRHGDRVKKLGRKKEHRVALLRNLCRSLFILEKIRTTLPKAKEAKKIAEHLIEYAKRSDLFSKRFIYRYIQDHKLVKIICDDIGPRFSKRHGGYTRIYRLGPRLGDGAEMAILELVEQSDPETITARRKLIERRYFIATQTKKKKIKKEKKQKEVKEKKKTVATRAKKKITVEKISKKKAAKKKAKKVKKEKQAKKRIKSQKPKKKRK